MQTFRREKRIAKKPKRFVETRKAIQKEKFLRKTLVKHRVAGIISRILEDEELFHSADEKCEDKKPVEPAEVSVTRPTNDVDINLPRPNKGIQRVCSAPQMVLIETEEEGPKEGQTSRAVGVREEMLLPANKKEIFYVYPENSLDEEYKSKVNYDDPVELRSKAKASGSTNESHESKQPLPSLWMVLPMPTFCQKTQPRPEVVRNDAFTIDFGAYRKSVMCNSFRKYSSGSHSWLRCVSMQFTGRTLLLPEQLTTAEEGSGFGRQPLKQW